jgi:hypothetical protein
MIVEDSNKKLKDSQTVFTLATRIVSPSEVVVA